MSTDRDTTRIVRSWLEEGVTALPDRVLDTVLDQLPATPQRRSLWPPRRFIPMPRPMAFAAAAAAAILVVLVGSQLLPTTPQPGVSPAVTSTPTSTVGPETVIPGQLPAGPRRVGVGGAVVTLDLPPGWSFYGTPTPSGAGFIRSSPNSPDLGLFVVTVSNLYREPCRPNNGVLDPPLGPSVEDLVAGLAGQPNTDAGPATDVTLSGFTGKQLRYAYAEDVPACSRLSRFPTSLGGDRQAIRGEIDDVWVLDVNGTRILIDLFSFERTDALALADARRIVENATIEP